MDFIPIRAFGKKMKANRKKHEQFGIYFEGERTRLVKVQGWRGKEWIDSRMSPRFLVQTYLGPLRPICRDKEN